MEKPFAILILTGLRVVRFEIKDEFYDAMRALKENETPFIALKYHYGAKRYVVPEREFDD